MLALAQEAKHALGGYFREFTFAPKVQAGWEACGCDAPSQPGTVLDPFMGSGTTLMVAQGLGRNAVGVDLSPPSRAEGRALMRRVVPGLPLAPYTG